MEPMRMMKTDAMRRERKSFEPPPEPQLTLSSAEAEGELVAVAEVVEVRASATESVVDMFVLRCNPRVPVFFLQHCTERGAKGGAMGRRRWERRCL